MKYSPNAWEKVSSTFDNGFQKRGWRDYRLNVLAWLRKLQGVQSVLDIACCRGEIGIKIREQGFSGRLAGVDITPSFIADAKKKGLEAVVADARELPFADREFDVSLLLNVVMHLDDPVRAVHEAARVSNRFLILSAYMAETRTPHHEESKSGLDAIEGRFLAWAYTDRELRSFLPAGWVCRDTALFSNKTGKRKIAQYLFERV